MDHNIYESEKARLKLERDKAGSAFDSWRSCQGCHARPMTYCPVHQDALARYTEARDRLRAHYNHVPDHLRPPSRVQRMRARLARWGRTPVWG